MENNSGRENGLRAMKTIKTLLTKIGWDPQKTDIEEVLLVDLSDENLPIISAHFDVRLDYERFLFYLNFKDHVPKKYLDETIKFITLVNYDLVIGNFELNIYDGFIRFKSSIDFTQVVLNETLIRNMIKSSMDTVEQYADALLDVMNGNKNALDALDEAEQDI